MMEKISMAKRLVAGFVELMLGERTPIRWGTRAAMSSDGGIHLPVPTTGDATEIALLTRLAAHEAGHRDHTEGGFQERLTDEEAGIFNALEDPRMEAMQMAAYPGARLVLSRGLTEALRSLAEKVDAVPDLPVELAIQLSLLLRGSMALGAASPWVEHGERIAQRAEQFLTARQLEAVTVAVSSLPGFRSSLDAEAAARALVARLREPEADAQDEQSTAEENGNGDQGSPADKSETTEQGTGPATQSDERAPADEPEASSDAQDHPGDGDNEQPQPNAADQSQAEGGDCDHPAEPTAADEQQLPSDDGMSAEGPNGDPGAHDAAGQHGAEGSATQGDAHLNAGTGHDGAGSEPVQDPRGNGAVAGDPAGINSHGQSAPTPPEGVQPRGDGQGASGMPPSGPGVEATADVQRKGAAGERSESFDLGALLREAHASQYGSPPDANLATDQEPIDGTAQDEGISDDAIVSALDRCLREAGADGSLDEVIELAVTILSGSPDADAHGPAILSFGAANALAGETHFSAPLDVRLAGVQSRLVNVLQRELQHQRPRPRRHGAAGSTVAANRMWRLRALGDANVFRAKRPATGIDAAGTILLDKSWSMNEVLERAAEVALAFSQALQRLGRVRTRTAVFPGTYEVTETLQEFGEAPRACASRCAALVAGGGTPLGAAIAIEIRKLMDARVQRRFLVVVTDDGPADPDVLAESLVHAARLGVVVIGVAIDCDISGYLPRSISIKDVDELPAALAGLFRSDMAALFTA